MSRMTIYLDTATPDLLGWMVHDTDPGVVANFGTDRLPLPFLAEISADHVLHTLRTENPGVDVRLGSRLRSGQRVTVFEDPLTRKRPEGVATLHAFLGRTDPALGGEWWSVCFEGDGYMQVERWVWPGFRTL